MHPRKAKIVAQTLAAGLWTTLSVVSLLLLIRRATGQFQPPLPPLLFASWSLVVTAWSSVALIGWRAYAESPNKAPAEAPADIGRRFLQWHQRWWPESLSGCLIALGILTTASPALLAGSGAMAGVMVIGGLATILILATEQPLPDTQVLSETLPQSCSETARLEPQSTPGTYPLPNVPADNESSEAGNFDPQTQQTMSRRITEGTESIEGICRVQFAETQRDTWVHLSFCPPLASSPELQLEDLDAAGWELKPAAIYPFGARINIRRSLHAPTTGCVAYFASCQAARAA